MKKLKLEDLDVVSFKVTGDEPQQRGTVYLHLHTGFECELAQTRWNCSQDFCSLETTCEPGSGGHYPSYHLNTCYPEPEGVRETTLDGYLTQFCTEGGSPCH